MLRVSGEFDLSAVERAERSLTRVVDAHPERVVVDLRSVSFLDVSGLTTLLRADARARHESITLGVVPPPNQAARIFELTDAARRLTLLENS